MIAGFQQQAAHELADQIAVERRTRSVLHRVGSVTRSVQQTLNHFSFRAQPDAMPFAECCELVRKPVKE